MDARTKKNEIPIHKFKLGDVVCNKAGGPAGTISYLPGRGAFQFTLIRIRFYKKQSVPTTDLAIEGAALIAGGDATISNNEFYQEWMEENKLKLCGELK